MKATLACAAVSFVMLAGTAAVRAQDYLPYGSYTGPVPAAPGSCQSCNKHFFGHHCGLVPGCAPHYASVGPVAPPACPFVGRGGGGQAPPQYPVHPFARSPRDFFMLEW